MRAHLYIVGTPIGNLEDITLRALRVLREADTILCEDTRVTRKLLARFELTKPLMSYHAHSGDAKYDKIVALLEEGQALALVTDAGTPGISDPGARLVTTVRDYFGDDVAIEAVPGPSAVTAALSIAGVPADTFTFLGFPPHKKGRETFFDTVVRVSGTVVFYESPHRIVKALTALTARLDEGRTVAVVRELTKLHEEVTRGTSSDVLAYFVEHSNAVRGEFVVVIGPEHQRRQAV